jgi:hypothetical protein
MSSYPRSVGRRLLHICFGAALTSLRVPLGEIVTDSNRNADSRDSAPEQVEREQIVRALRERNWVVGGV